MSQVKLTPMLEQYLQMKEQYPDALLFFRMGDFYELFFEDAEIAARELQIALTSRSSHTANKVPMCGVPHHSLEEYLPALLENNYKLAICDQIEDPKQAKGLVKREVTRVLTPGTIIESGGLDSKTHNYLGSLFFDKSKGCGGLAWLDYSTGEWTGLQTKSYDQIWQWIGKIQPREILCAEGQDLPPQFHDLKDRINWLPVIAYFDYKQARNQILEVQKISSLTPLDLNDKPELIRCCGAILTYLRQTQKQDLAHLQAFKPLHLGKHLIIDDVTERNLELFQRLDGHTGPGTLWHVIDQTMTPMGGRLLRTRLRYPWRDLNTILTEQGVVLFLKNLKQCRQMLRKQLDQVFDLQRLTTRITLNRCSPKDFVALRTSLQQLPDILETLTHEDTELPERLRDLVETWDPLQDITRLLDQSLVDNPPHIITEGGLFREGFHKELDELLELSEHGQKKLNTLLEHEQKASQLPKLKVGFNKVFGYYFELSKAFKGQVPKHFHRRQTLVNAERYVTDELKELEEKIFNAQEKRKNLEYTLFQEIREKVSQARERILLMAEHLGLLDYWQGLAQAAATWDWCQPSLHTGQEISISKGRHPVVEASQGKTNYIPNDLHLSDTDRLLLITGPNMAGKSTVLRQAALICLLAQIGSFVPAKEAHIGIADRIFTRVGASDNLAQGQSTFMVEMTETAMILRQAGKRSLVILDEIGRGTSTFDGLALAWAVVEQLAQKGHNGIRTLFATHYHELTQLEGIIPGIRNYNIAVKEWQGEIIFLRKMVPGPADRSYGIEVAKLAGVPQNVTQRAKDILVTLERKSEHLKIDHNKSSQRRQTLLPELLKKEAQSNKDTLPSQKRHPLLKELQHIDTNTLTPLEALNTLNQWKEKWGNNG
jgi:DNA mismatch repair protein MutS